MDVEPMPGDYRRSHGRYPLYDPPWLRRSHTTCLWDGAPRQAGSEFCSVRCEERYLEWEESMTSHYVAREPLETFLSPEEEPDL
ncbi:hypothetical protein BMS3Abin02_00086 [bacterium BMS3Abin02]|nr:hypothetical protein BMS3Abin02_00086 [bacterium BMS3Abin02]GBE21940.1 hypothetical protein BMS3Bbin01_01294 [bacterium BMS3Bbin01]HDH25350.1 hypothetical protein [Actinomycetota bacterium]